MWRGRLVRRLVLGLTLVATVALAAEKDPQKVNAAEQLEKAARKGDPEAMAKLGTAYYSGLIGGKADYKQAVYWYQQAAERKNSYGIFNLGICYEKGHGVEANVNKALECYRTAAEQGLMQAQLNAAIMLRDQFNKPAEAARYFRMAADQGNLASQREFGRLVVTGAAGPVATPEEALRYLEKAARAGDLPAQMLCADAYGGQYPGIARDSAKMVDYLWQAAGANDPEAIAKVGYCYEFGIGFAVDEVSALKWYRKAADLGAPQAMVNLGNFHLKGRVVPKDEQKALAYFRQAAERKFPLGYYNLGVAYALGRGVPVDEKVAFEWFGKAAEAGEPQGQFNLGVCYAKGQGVAADAAKAYQWFEKAAAKGEPRALTELGYCYLEGNGTQKNLLKAKECFERAALAKYPEAEAALRSFFPN